MTNITFYKLQYVKEKASRYDIERKVNSPEVAHDIFRKVFNMSEESEEILAMLALNTKNQVIGVFEVSRGNLNSSLVHPREVYKRALLLNACSIVVAHNHPSGDPSPSKDDVLITERLKESGKMIGVELLDHLIICENAFISLKQKGLI